MIAYGNTAAQIYLCLIDSVLEYCIIPAIPYYRFYFLSNQKNCRTISVRQLSKLFCFMPQVYDGSIMFRHFCQMPELLLCICVGQGPRIIRFDSQALCRKSIQCTLESSFSLPGKDLGDQ